jgi:hypothetical protein
MELEKVINRQKVADTIHGFLEAGMALLGKDKFSADDHAKIKVLRTMSSHVSAAVAMVQQETAQQRLVLVTERMKQLGYAEPKMLQSGEPQG